MAHSQMSIAPQNTNVLNAILKSYELEDVLGQIEFEITREYVKLVTETLRLINWAVQDHASAAHQDSMYGEMVAWTLKCNIDEIRSFICASRDFSDRYDPRTWTRAETSREIEKMNDQFGTWLDQIFEVLESVTYCASDIHKSVKCIRADLRDVKSGRRPGRTVVVERKLSRPKEGSVRVSAIV